MMQTPPPHLSNPNRQSYRNSLRAISPSIAVDPGKKMISPATLGHVIMVLADKDIGNLSSEVPFSCFDSNLTPDHSESSFLDDDFVSIWDSEIAPIIHPTIDQMATPQKTLSGKSQQHDSSPCAPISTVRPPSGR